MSSDGPPFLTPRRLALVAGLTALVVLAGAITLHVARPRPLHLPEGVIARPLSLDGRVDVARLDDDRLTLVLVAGHARFTVPPGVRRRVVIEVPANVSPESAPEAAPLRLRPDGAVFEAARTSDAVELTVQRGAVHTPGATLGAGESTRLSLR